MFHGKKAINSYLWHRRGRYKCANEWEATPGEWMDEFYTPCPDKRGSLIWLTVPLQSNCDDGKVTSRMAEPRTLETAPLKRWPGTCHRVTIWWIYCKKLSWPYRSSGDPRRVTYEGVAICNLLSVYSLALHRRSLWWNSCVRWRKSCYGIEDRVESFTFSCYEGAQCSNMEW